MEMVEKILSHFIEGENDTLGYMKKYFLLNFLKFLPFNLIVFLHVLELWKRIKND